MVEDWTGSGGGGMNVWWVVVMEVKPGNGGGVDGLKLI